MTRREFITLLPGAVVWPLPARAQQSQRLRRVGVLMSAAADDPLSIARYTAFLQGLQALGWTDGRNVRIDVRCSAGDAQRARKYAAEIVALSPDVIMTNGSMSLEVQEWGAAQDPSVLKRTLAYIRGLRFSRMTGRTRYGKPVDAPIVESPFMHREFQRAHTDPMPIICYSQRHSIRPSWDTSVVGH